MDYFMRMLNIGFYFVLGLIVFSPIATAQTAPTNQGFGSNGVFVQAVGSKSASVSGNNVVSMQQFRVTNGTAPLKYYDRAVAYNKAQYGAKVKGIIKANALNATLIATTLALGYYLDYITGDLYQTPATPSMTCTTTLYTFNSPYGALEDCTLSAVIAKYKSKHVKHLPTVGDGISYQPPYSFRNESFTDDTATQVTYNLDWSYYYYGTQYWVSNQSFLINKQTTNLQVQAQPNADPMTDTQLAQWYLDNSAPDTWAQPFVNPQTGAVIRDSVNAQAEKDLYNEIAPTLGKPQSTANPVTPPLVQNAPSYDTQNPNSGANTSLEFPSFCSWASVVCDFIDWTKEPPEEPSDSGFIFADLIEEKEIVLESYQSGLGNGSCPSPKSFTVLTASLTYSYEPVCNMADVARPFVIIFAYITSIFVLLGIRR
jgi:hypothetical protein